MYDDYVSRSFKLHTPPGFRVADLGVCIGLEKLHERATVGDIPL